MYSNFEKDGLSSRDKNSETEEKKEEIYSLKSKRKDDFQDLKNLQNTENSKEIVKEIQELKNTPYFGFQKKIDDYPLSRSEYTIINESQLIK